MASKINYEPELYYKNAENGKGYTKIKSGKTVFNIESTFGEKSVYSVLLNIALKKLNKNDDTGTNL